MKTAAKRRKEQSDRHVQRSIVRKRKPVELKLEEKVEQALIDGNLANLTPEQRVSLCMATCKSLGLNPLTKPFLYILVSGWDNDQEKLILYASRNCTDQLRAKYRISDVPGSLKRSVEDGMLQAEITIQDPTGKVTTDFGVIPLRRYSRKKQGWYELSGPTLANAKMHVVTKARRRATLAHCGLGGIVDESELDTMRVVGGMTPEGRVFRYQTTALLEAPDTSLSQTKDHGWPQGSERARQAEEQLRKVEAADLELARKRSEPPASSQESSQTRAETEGMLPGQRDNAASPKASAQDRAETTTTVGKGGGKHLPVSAAPVVVGEETIECIIQRVNAGMAGKYPIRQVTVLLADKTKPTYTTFDKDLFERLDQGVGKTATLIIKHARSDYVNIVAVLRIASQEFLRDGTPVIAKDREPGSLFK